MVCEGCASYVLCLERGGFLVGVDGKEWWLVTGANHFV